MKHLVYKAGTLAAIMILALPMYVFADGPGFGGGVEDGGCAVPLDGGLSMLLAAGVGYGIKKFRDNRKSVQAKETEL